MRTSERNGKAARKLFLWLLMVAMLLSSVSSVFADASPAAELEAVETAEVEESAGLNVSSLTAANQTAALDEVVLGDFEDSSESWRLSLGPEFPGAVGGYERVETNTISNSYAAQLSGNFNAGGQYVSMRRGIDSLDMQQLSLSVKTEDLGKLRLRLIDNTGQVHQQRLALQADGKWQTITVSTFAGGEGYEHFSGANDGVWHAPAREIVLILERSDLLSGKKQGEILIDNVIASIPMPPLMLRQKQLGNIFVEGEQPAIDIATAGDAVSWTIFDFWGNEAISGQSEPVNGIVNVVPALTSKGYYTIKVTAYSEGTLLDTKETSLALLAPFDLQQITDSPFGVGTHFGQNWSPELIPLLSKLGVKNIRDEIYWDAVETAKGEYTFLDKHEVFMERLKESAIKPFIIFSYTNKFYDQGSTPYSDEGREGFANYGAALLEKYGSQMDWVEVYNEFNHPGAGNIGNGQANSKAEYYYKLLKKTYEAVKTYDPTVEVIGPATSGVPLPWLEKLFQLGGLSYMDAVSIHPYRFPLAPESGTAELQQLQDLIKTYNAGQAKPIWMSEMGWPTFEDYSGIDEKTQAAFLIRSTVLALANGVEKYFWYDFMNDGVNPLNKEHNFGIIRNASSQLGKNAPKPAYVSMATMTRALSSASFKKMETVAPGVYSLVFEETGEEIRVLWSDTPQQVTATAANTVTVTDMMGNLQDYESSALGAMSLFVSEYPVFVKGNVDDIQAGSVFKLLNRETAVGDPVVLTLQMDQSIVGTGNVPLDAMLEIEGLSFPFKVGGSAPNQVKIELPAEYKLGEKLLKGEVFVEGKRTAQLNTTVTITAPISLEAKHTWKNGMDSLDVSIINHTLTARNIKSLDWTIGSITGTETIDKTINSLTNLIVEMPLKKLASQNYVLTLTLHTDLAQPTTYTGTIVIKDESSFYDFAYQTIKIDGKLDKLEQAPVIDWGKDGQVKLNPYLGEDDLSGKMYVTWDKDNLYLSAQVRDDVMAQTQTGDQIWNGDSIQFALAPGLPGEVEQWYEIGMALTPQGPQIYRWNDRGKKDGPITTAKLAIERNEQHAETIYELALPWSEIDAIVPEDRIFSFSFLVNDNDGQGRKGYLEWGSGIGASKGPQYFNAVRLIGEVPSNSGGDGGGTTYPELPEPSTKPDGGDGGELPDPELPEQSGNVDAPFPDIMDHWAKNYIIKAFAKKIVAGYPDDTFKPERFVTRAEFIHMLMKAVEQDEKMIEEAGETPSTLIFKDVAEIGNWARKSIALAVQAGVVQGYPDGTLRPNAAISRIEMAMMLAKAMKLSVTDSIKTSFSDDHEIPDWVKGEVADLHKLGLLHGKSNNRFVPNAETTRAEAVTVFIRMLELEH